MLSISVDRILDNILWCSPLVMSECELLLELGSSHCQGQCESLYSWIPRSSLPLDYHHDRLFD